MSGAKIIQIGGSAEIDTAWADYQRLCLAEERAPALRFDRDHVQAKIRAFARFEQLYLAGERQAEIIEFPRGGK